MRIMNQNDKDAAALRLDDDRQHLQPVLDAVARWAREGAECQPNFWERQRAEIMSRVSALESQGVARVPRLAWAIASAVLVIASFMLNSGPRVEPVLRAQTDPDRELLVEIERAMQTGGPTALEPAAMLDEEIADYENTSSALQHQREGSHEE
jgi:hypothetical protein